jgi:hypothetical protein
MAKVKIVKTATTVSVPNDFIRLWAITDDGYYIYKIKYFVDPVQASRDKTFNVLIQLSREPYVYQEVKTFNTTNSGDIIKNLLLRQSRQKDLVLSQRNKYFFTYTSDITKRIPNDNANLLTKNFANNLVFSKKITVKPTPTAQLEDANLSLPILDVNKNTSNFSTVISNKSVKSSANLLIQNLQLDPAKVAGAKTNNLVSAGVSFKGTVANKTNTNTRTDVDSRFLSNTLINTNNITNQGQNYNLPYINVLFREETKYIEIEETIKIPVGDLQFEEFYVVFDLLDGKGLVRQTVNRIVPHSRFVSELEIPTEAPTITSLSVGRLGNTALDIKQMDDNAVGVNLYRREMNQTSPGQNATYDFIGKVDIKKIRWGQTSCRYICINKSDYISCHSS